jgi:ankyrin repeat protein/serine/threonine protein kinase
MPPYTLESGSKLFSIGSYSVRPSREPTASSANGASYIDQGLAKWSTAFNHSKPLEAIVDALQWSGLPGPLVLVSDREYLGQGSQFVVYKRGMAVAENDRFAIRAVAIKQPKFDLDPNVAVNLADPTVQRHLHHVYLEILALTNPLLRSHANICKLIGWSKDPYGLHSPLVLVMELALLNVSEWLDLKEEGMKASSKHQICKDIAEGLDALHDCRIVHGDLKPANVLMYRQHNRRIAKLADFGLAMDEVAEYQSFMGGTPGWMAPEVEERRPLSLDLFPRTDNFSCGLVVWSIFCHSGKVPPQTNTENRIVLARKELDENKVRLGMAMHSNMADALEALLQQNPEKRPSKVGGYFDSDYGNDDDDNDYDNGAKDSDDTSGAEYSGEALPRKPEEYLPWELPAISYMFTDELYSRFMNEPRSLSGEVLFALFMAFTIRPKKPGSVDPGLDVLAVAALDGYEPAQATIHNVYKFHKEEPAEEIKQHIYGWQKKAAATGSIVAREFLSNLDECSDATSEFKGLGGYNRLYCYVSSQRETDKSGVMLEPDPETGYSHLHWVAAYGIHSELVKYLCSKREIKINIMTDQQETALYLACARGAWDIALELLDRGASPSLPCTRWSITCMHWIFAFDKEIQVSVVAELKHRGADINAIACEAPFLHYPFLLPAGTPLHWACAISSHNTIRALVKLGSDVLVRNGTDPYIYDDRVRNLNKFGGPNQLSFSIAEIPTLGLTPLDIAAMQHDPFVFEYLISRSIEVDINSVDEEGFSVLHRLSASHIRHIRRGNTFSDLPFRGSQDEMKEKLRRTVAAIKSLGGDLELLTTSKASNAQGERVRIATPSRTPLMLALLNGAIDVAQALLEFGARTDTETDEGETALHCIPEDDITAVECLKVLLSYGADSQHRDRSGRTPCSKAAHMRNVNAVEILLAEGADIDERQLNPLRYMEGSCLFAHLAYEEEPFKEEKDLQVSRLLYQYVFATSDGEKKRRVIEVGDIEGQTLLHRFASASMPHCVQTLILHGALVNALHKKVSMERDDTGSQFKVLSCKTPLDAALRTKERRIKEMHTNRSHTMREHANLVERDETVISIIKQAGGSLSNEPDKKKSLTLDPSIYRENPEKIRRALREF